MGQVRNSDLLKALQIYLRDGTETEAVAWRAAAGGVAVGTSRLFAGLAPEGTTGPYATFIQIGGTTDGSMAGEHLLPVVQFSFWHKDAITCYLLADEFYSAINRRHEALQTHHPNAADSKIIAVRSSRPGRLAYDAQAETHVLHVDYDFEIG